MTDNPNSFTREQIRKKLYSATEEAVIRRDATMFWLRLLERYSPGTGFGSDKAFEALVADIGEHSIGPDYLPALADYELEPHRFMKCAWVLLAPEKFDIMGSERIFDLPMLIEDPEWFRSKLMWEWKIRCLMDMIEEFSDPRYYLGDDYKRSMGSEVYMELAFALLPHIERIENKTERDKLLRRTVRFLSENFFFERAAEGDFWIHGEEWKTIGEFLLKNDADHRKLLSLGRKKSFRWSNSFSEKSSELALLILPHIDHIEGEKDTLWEKAATVLMQNFFRSAAMGGMSQRCVKNAVMFLLKSRDITDETKMLVLREVIEKNITNVLETKGPWSQKRSWMLEPLHLYAGFIEDILKEDSDFPYSKEIFAHQARFIMEMARKYYGCGGYFPLCKTDKILSLLSEEDGRELARFVLTISRCATNVHDEEDIRQLLLLTAMIPPEESDLCYRAWGMIRNDRAWERKKIEDDKRRDALIRALC